MAQLVLPVWMHMRGEDSAHHSSQPRIVYVRIALADVGRRIATTNVNPEGLEAFVACRLIPLDKCPGVRPIGVGEVPRRIIAKAVLRVIGNDVVDAAGPFQLCAAQVGGCEAAVHAMRSEFQSPNKTKLYFWLMQTTRLIH